jgi:2-polyprenyl-3-methyl-5-hydroxy-6-metoxy-1,4-benzoquinol methylase
MGYTEFPCDLCGGDDSIELPHSREFHDGQPIDICRRCGFVYVKRRRTAREIAETWSSRIFGEVYTAATPAVRARLTFVAEFANEAVGLGGKRVCEIGAGEGHGLELLREPRYAASVFGIEPSPVNCARLRAAGIDCFEGTIEEYVASPGRTHQRFDVVTIQWTLENCQSCRAMLEAARRALTPDGSLVVATGSRILVPFKKPLHMYFGRMPADTHAFRFSASTLRGLLAVSGFDVTHINRYLDHDVLCAIARPRPENAPAPPWSGDNYRDVYGFFERWYADTTLYFPEEHGPDVSGRVPAR